MEQHVGLEGMTNGNVEKPAAVRRMHCNYSAAEEKHQPFISILQPAKPANGTGIVYG